MNVGVPGRFVLPNFGAKARVASVRGMADDGDVNQIVTLLAGHFYKRGHYGNQ
jgi:hypothetical protein